jgi:hypothetical protein
MSLVWYVSYGSNMHVDRFTCYVAGGTPDGGNRSYPGCRDRTPPLAIRGCSVPGGVYFATESPVWGGGRAFFDPELPGVAHARAYLITEKQFADVREQEMYREPGTDLDLREVLANGRARLGDGRYETLIHLGDHDDHPMLTFTAPWSFGQEPLVAPTPPYLRMLGHGLLSAHGWSLREAAGYLAGLPGAAGVWSVDEIVPMLYPHVVLTCAMTADGRVDTVADPVNDLRAGCDAILSGTTGQLEVTLTTGKDRSADRTHIPNGDTRKLVYEPSGDLRTVMHDLAERGIRRLVVDGSTTAYPRFLAAGLADEIHLVVAPTAEVRRWKSVWPGT